MKNIFSKTLDIRKNRCIFATYLKKTIMKSQETFKATFSNGQSERVSAQTIYEAKRYFLREFCRNEDGDSNGVTIVELEQITNYNKG